MNTDTTPQTLIPPCLKHARMLIWVAVLPQLLLLAMNGRAWNLIHGEFSDQQATQALIVGAYELLLLIAAGGLRAFLWLRRRNLSILACIPLFLLHVGYLWLLTIWCFDILPDSVTTWILLPSQVMYYQFALMMPATFYFGLRIAGFKLALPRWGDSLVTFGTLFGIPVFWFMIMQVSQWIFRWHGVPAVVAIIVMTASTILILMAFLRALLLVYGSLHSRYANYMLVAGAGLAGPIGGLILNRVIPFPYDFQDPAIYALAIANGIILLLPFGRALHQRAITWLLRAMAFSFTLYFFIVFLPFLPLSLLAMIAAGAGFLILTPTLLFIIHTRQLWDEGLTLVATFGATRVIAAFMVAVSVLPAGYLGRAYVDRQALAAAIELIYTPDYTQQETDVHLPAIRRSLHRLRDMKQGIFLPFLSDTYNAIVFNGMALPDRKIETIETILFGAPQVPEHAQGDRFADIFGRRRNTRRRWNQRRSPPGRSVALEALQAESIASNGFIRTTATLQLQNQGDGDSEFVTFIHVPEGVMVSGYWLDVEGERVPGRIFEKKTAVWVYEMIRDVTRRDPGLLVFESQHRLKLSVFPFNAQQHRVTGIEFLYPEGLAPIVQIGDRELPLNASPTADEPTIIQLPSHAHAETRWVVLDAAATRLLPTRTRRPYLHFILDHSAASKTNQTDFVARMQRAAAAFPDARECRITRANFEFESALAKTDTQSANLAHIADNMLPPQLPYRGAFCPERVIKHALIAYGQSSGLAADGTPHVPVFIVIPNAGTTHREGGLESFARATPDVQGYLESDSTGPLMLYPFDPTTPPTPVTSYAPGEIVLLRADGRTHAILPGGPAMVPIVTEAAGITVIPRATGETQPLRITQAITRDSIYSKALDLWAVYHATQLHPQTLKDALPGIVRTSRETGVIVPPTSYMVVENSAQWKTLERRQKQALRAHTALEFDEGPTMESPAPAILWLIPLAVLLLRKSHTR